MTFKIREICGNSWLNFKHTKSFNQFNTKTRRGGSRAAPTPATVFWFAGGKSNLPVA